MIYHISNQLKKLQDFNWTNVRLLPYSENKTQGTKRIPKEEKKQKELVTKFLESLSFKLPES